MFFRKPLHALVITGSSVLFAAVFVCALLLHIRSYSHLPQPLPLSPDEQTALQHMLSDANPQPPVSPLPYPLAPHDMSVNAESAILIDASNGSILYEKNADELIPPASMTKLVVMYVVLQEVATGRISLSDTVPLPKESWAVNLPSDSSLMFLAQGQTVTLEELLLGLSIASGNDAAIAVADYVSGSVEAFVQRMNAEVQKLGLEKTYFEEPSGYSEKNLTTAREFAAFARVYLSRFPETIAKFHSQRLIAFPQEHNLAPWHRNAGQQPIIQYNTNKLLGMLDGVDGLKTGFIYQSGYNLALTAKRGATRYISVTMRGPGYGSTEGNRYRVMDGTTLMEWAFSRFHTAEKPAVAAAAAVFGGTQKNVLLVPAYTGTLTVPHIAGIDSATPVTAAVSVPHSLDAPVAPGETHGSVTYMLGNIPLETVPLVAARSVPQAGILKRAADIPAKAIWKRAAGAQ